MTDAIAYRLPAAAPRAQQTAQKVGPVLEQASAGTMGGDRLTLSSGDDYARRHAEAFQAAEPPKAPSRKFSLGVQLDEATRLSIKPSLKKIQLDLKIKF